MSLDGVPALRPAVGDVTQQSYPAEAGLETGDRIVAVGDARTDSWDRALITMFDHLSADGRIPMTLESMHGGRRTAVIQVGEDASRLTEPDGLFDGLGFRPGAPPAIVGVPMADGAAMAAGIRAGDRIVGIAGDEVAGFTDLINAVERRPAETVVIEFVRDGRLESVTAVLDSVVRDGKSAGLLGVPLLVDDLGPVEAVAAAVERTWSSTAFTLKMLGRMVTGDVSIKNISGPINIAQFAGTSAQRGFNDFLGFLAIVSISLGVLNLLPVPVLDGGQIVYQGIEWVKGSPMSERAQIIGQQFGILALIVLMSFAFYNDIARMIG